MTEMAAAKAQRDPRYEEQADENWPNQSEAGLLMASRFDDEPFALLRIVMPTCGSLLSVQLLRQHKAHRQLLAKPFGCDEW